jgi:predicted glycosyltransferase
LSTADLTRTAPRIAFFSNDPGGLGHLRRILKIAWYLRGRWPESTQLIVTGSPGVQMLSLPDDAELLKLPSVKSSGFRKYAARYLPISFPEIWELRRDLLLSLGRLYQPDIALVDHMPAGLRGDLLPCLREFKARSPHTRLVLGLRDVTYDPGLLRTAWASEGIYELLDELYDLILVFGQRKFLDVVEEYGFSRTAASKTRHVGYLGASPSARSPEAVRAQLGLRTARLVVVTVGGGDMGLHLLHTMFEAVKLIPGDLPFDCLLVCGPLTSTESFGSLRALVGERPGMHVRHYVQDLREYIAAADLVVATAGYNSVCEILSSGRPAILVPQLHENGEQVLRAGLMSRLGLFRILEPSDLSPARLLAYALESLEHPIGDRPPVDLNGLAAAAAELEGILRTK